VKYIDTPTAFKERVAQGDSCIWEQYIDGPEFSVEAVTFHATHQILGITEKVTTGPPNFVEVGHFAPARLSAKDVNNITNMVTRCLNALGVSKGASHTEVKYVKSHAFLIETHTRAGGDRIPLLTKLVSGYDQYELAVRSILGMGTLTPKEKTFNCAGVQYFRWAQGIVSSIEGIDVCRTTHDGLVELELKVSQGSYIPQWKDSSDRPGFAVVGGENIEEIQKKLAIIEAQIKVSYEE
jgi:hypothetical protein